MDVELLNHARNLKTYKTLINAMKKDKIDEPP